MKFFKNNKINNTSYTSNSVLQTQAIWDYHRTINQIQNRLKESSPAHDLTAKTQSNFSSYLFYGGLILSGMVGVGLGVFVTLKYLKFTDSLKDKNLNIENKALKTIEINETKEDINANLNNETSREENVDINAATANQDSDAQLDYSFCQGVTP